MYIAIIAVVLRIVDVYKQITCKNGLDGLRSFVNKLLRYSDLKLQRLEAIVELVSGTYIKNVNIFVVILMGFGKSLI